MKRRMSILHTGALAAVLVAAAVAIAAVPQTINYQGHLTDASGTPVNGTIQIQFKLYSSETGTELPFWTERWSETHQNVHVSQGKYDVVLGNGNPPVPIVLPFDVPYYLGVTVGADAEMTPRMPLTSTGYAFKAKTADSIVSSGSVTITGGMNGNVVIAPGGSGTVDVRYARITNVASPTMLGDVANKYYVDNEIQKMTTWLIVTGASEQAAPNTGYLAYGESQVTITLPASKYFYPGDFVKVSGIGSGGWKIAQSPGQRVVTKNLFPQYYGNHWTPRESNRNWHSVASSSDGTRLVAVVDGGQIYTSADSGVTWTPRESNRNWRSVASSSDGTRLVAVDGCTQIGQIYTSADSGVTWTPRESAPARNWSSVASSSDGTRLVAVVGCGHIESGQIYTSTDSGVTWTSRESAPARNWSSVASSSDGTRLVAVVAGGQIYTSTDSGFTWTAREFGRVWYSVASSSDGTRLVAVDNDGQIYTSTDSGFTWTPRESARKWMSVASSSDGTRLVAVVYHGQIYTSMDSGVSWTQAQGQPDRSWWSVASSSDGTRLVAVVGGGQIYTSDAFTTPGIEGSLSGDQFDAVELQYIGNNIFMILSHEGNLVVK